MMRPPAGGLRRRTITMVGALAGLGLPLGDRRSAEGFQLYQWTGTSLGSPSRLLLYHWDRAAAQRIVARCAAEIGRLEQVFALYRSDSELARLNRDGRLEEPGQDLLVLLSQCRRFGELSGGAFDVTVQPLWNLYARHFFGSPAPASEGPGPRAIEAALKLVDWQGIDFRPRGVVLARAGMGLTLNGIAQGYVTDRITDILRDSGCDRVLADLGRSEISASGRHSSGEPWRVGLADPRRPETVALALDLVDGAVCTSGGYGTKFEASGRFHHLFDPTSGASAHHYIATSVFATSAMIADALSTTIYVMPPERGPPLLAGFPGVTALVTRPDGTVQRLGA